MKRLEVLEECKKISWLFTRAVELLYPPCCPFCDKRLRSVEQMAGVCKWCQSKLVYITDNHCLKCGKPLENEREEFCYDCGRRKHPYEQARALLSYQGNVRASLRRFKDGNRREYARFYGQEIMRFLGRWIAHCRADYLIPIPLSEKKERERGYNQAVVLAEQISKQTGIPCLQHVLYKRFDTQQQKDLDAKARQKNLEAAFELSNESMHIPLAGKCVILVDDIYTTGATVDGAATILRRAGVSKIYVLTVAIGG